MNVNTVRVVPTYPTVYYMLSTVCTQSSVLTTRVLPCVSCPYRAVTVPGTTSPPPVRRGLQALHSTHHIRRWAGGRGRRISQLRGIGESRGHHANHVDPSYRRSHVTFSFMLLRHAHPSTVDARASNGRPCRSHARPHHVRKGTSSSNRPYTARYPEGCPGD
jgi:hypothetical protein